MNELECTCHIDPPCSYCLNLTPEELYRKELLREINFLRLKIRELEAHRSSMATQWAEDRAKKEEIEFCNQKLALDQLELLKKIDDLKFTLQEIAETKMHHAAYGYRIEQTEHLTSPDQIECDAQVKAKEALKKLGA